jgi:cyclase
MYSKHFNAVELAPGVWAAYADPVGAAFGNAGIIDLGGQTLVFDTFLTPQAGHDLRRFAEETTGRAPKLVVNSHFHNDHVWGNQAFLPEAHLISSKVTRDLLSTRGVEDLQRFSSEAPEHLPALEAQRDRLAAEGDARTLAELAIWIAFFGGIQEALPALRLCLPTVTFDQRLTLHGEKQKVELIAYPGGHTASDTALFLPESGIVFLADLLFNGCHPLMVDGNPHRLKAILLELIGMDADVYIPGHGPAGGKDDLRRMIEYIDACLEIASGCQSDEDLPHLLPPSICDRWVYRPFFETNMRFLRKARTANTDQGV